MINTYLIGVINDDNDILEHKFVDDQEYTYEQIVNQAKTMLGLFLNQAGDEYYCSAFVARIVADVSGDVKTVLNFTITTFE